MDLNASFDNTPPTSDPVIPRVVVPEIESFQKLDAQSELLYQYNVAKRLLAEAEYNDGIPLNQKAQALNTISSILGNIIKTRTDLYNAERLRLLEETLVEVLQEFPSISAQFLPLYEARLQIKGKK